MICAFPCFFPRRWTVSGYGTALWRWTRLWEVFDDAGVGVAPGLFPIHRCDEAADSNDDEEWRGGHRLFMYCIALLRTVWRTQAKKNPRTHLTCPSNILWRSCCRCSSSFMQPCCSPIQTDKKKPTLHALEGEGGVAGTYRHLGRCVPSLRIN